MNEPAQQALLAGDRPCVAHGRAREFVRIVRRVVGQRSVGRCHHVRDSRGGRRWAGAAALARGGATDPSARALNVWFTLPGEGPASLELIDIAGRRKVREEVGSLGPGQHLRGLNESGQLRPGLYWVRLTRAGERRTARVVLTR